ncbi:MAG: hypothetical protein FJY07_09870 [Bacteroidetes bacterium]|nr:hypothetical protein [Bacteroidota bacterium]
MTIPNEAIVGLLKEISNRISEPVYKEIYLVVTGAIIGFLGSLIIYLLQERKRKKEYFVKFIRNLYTLAEELRHNANAIRIESYRLQYYSRQAYLMIDNKAYSGENNGIIQRLMIVIDERGREREVLSAKLSGIIAEHNIYFGEKSNINEALNILKNFDFKKQFFDEINDLESLRSAYNPDFTKTLSDEMEETYTKDLHNLVYLIRDSINEGKENSFLNKFKKKR